MFIVAFATAAPAVAQTPRQIEALERQVLGLLVDNKAAEALPILEKALATFPDSPTVHELLATAHGAIAESLEAQPEHRSTRRGHLERAARHYRRALDLTHVNRASHLHSLAEIYLPGGLNDLGEAERYARRLTTEHPTLRSGHAVLVRALVAARRAADAIAALRGIASLPPKEQAEVVAVGLQDIIGPEVVIDREVLRPLLDESLRITTAAIASAPDNGELLMLKGILLDIQARKLERDPARQRALLAEYKELWEKGRALNQAKPGAEPPAPPAPPEIPPAARAAYTRGVILWQEVSSNPATPGPDATKKLEAAIRALDEALTLHPAYLEAMVYKSLVLRLRASKYEPDAARAAALIAEADRLRARALELQRAKIR